jgi:hypothetical protein
VVAIYQKVYGNNHYQTGIGLANLASTYMAGKKFTQAEKLFREALEIYARTLPPEHTNVGIGRIKLGRSLLRQKRYTGSRHRNARRLRTTEEADGTRGVLAQGCPHGSHRRVRSAETTAAG